MAVGYGRLLHVAIGRWTRWIIVGIALMSFVGGIMLVTTGILSTEFFPNADNGSLQVNLEMPPGTTLDMTNTAAGKVEQRIMTWPEVSQVFTSVGQSGGFGPGQARFATMQVQLVDKKQRVRTPEHGPRNGWQADWRYLVRRGPAWRAGASRLAPGRPPGRRGRVRTRCRRTAAPLSRPGSIRPGGPSWRAPQKAV